MLQKGKKWLTVSYYTENENQLFADVSEMAETFFTFGSLLANNKGTNNEELAKNLSEVFAEKILNWHWRGLEN